MIYLPGVDQATLELFKKLIYEGEISEFLKYKLLTGLLQIF